MHGRKIATLLVVAAIATACGTFIGTDGESDKPPPPAGGGSSSSGSGSTSEDASSADGAVAVDSGAPLTPAGGACVTSSECASGKCEGGGKLNDAGFYTGVCVEKATCVGDAKQSKGGTFVSCPDVTPCLGFICLETGINPREPSGIVRCAVPGEECENGFGSRVPGCCYSTCDDATKKCTPGQP